MMDGDGSGDGSVEGKYILSGTTIPGVDVPNVTLTAASGESVDLPDLGTVECASDDGCSGTVVDGVLTITGDLKIVSVDPALDSETAMLLAGLAVDMLPEPTPAEQLAAAQTAVSDAEAAVAVAATAAERASAYAQLAAAEQMLAEAEAIPENVLTALRQRLAEAEDDLDEAETAAMNLRDAVDAINAAQTAAAALDADSDQAAVDAASALVTAAHNAVSALDADDQARLSSQVSSANYMVMATQTRLDNAVTVAANTKSAGTKSAAIGDEATQTLGATLGGSDEDGTAVETYSYTITRDSDGTTIEIADTANAADDDPKFEDQMAGLDAGRTMLVREMEADDDGNVVEEVVIVRTDIAAPKPVDFAKFEGRAATGMATMPQMLNVDLDPDMDADSDGTATNDLTALSVDVSGSDDEDAAVYKLVMSGSFPTAGGGSSTATHTFLPAVADADTDTLGNQPREAAMVDGTYNGSDGMYRCNGTDDCTVTVNDKGAVIGMTDDWVFIPDDDVTTDQRDYEYLSYGFWLKKATDSDGVLTYNEVETFATAHGMDPSNATGIGVVTGSATYDGDAVGVYVKNVLDGQANILSATSGHFKADVELTANFGGGNVADNNKFAIGGTMDNFALQHGETNDWAVSLGLADFSGRTGMGPGKEEAGSDFKNVFNGTATGDSTSAAGSWNGAFYGEAGQLNHDNNADTPDVNTAPGAVVGEFNANFTDGTVAGGYGANKK